MGNDRKRLDTVPAGFIPGLILPVATLLILWMIRFEGSLAEFLSSFQRLELLSKVVSLSAIPNLLLFFICIWTNRNFAARGVIMATILVALVMLVLKIA